MKNADPTHTRTPCPGEPHRPAGRVRVLKYCLPGGLLLAGILVFTFSTRLRSQVSTTTSDPTPPPVTTVRVKPYRGTIDIVADGSVVPHREIVLSAEVGGRIVHKHPQVQSGNFVSAGTTLVRVDARDYQLAVDRLRHDLAQAKARLIELQVHQDNNAALLKLAAEDQQVKARIVARFTKLRQQRAAADSDVDQATSAEIAARQTRQSYENQQRSLAAQRTTAEAAVNLVGARLSQAELELSRTRIVAPIDGVIVSESIEENNSVQPGQPLLCIDDTSALEVRTQLRSDQLQRIMQSALPAASATELPHLPVTIVRQVAQRQYAWQGVLQRREGTGVDLRTRTVPCRIRVPQPNQARVLAADSDSDQQGTQAAPARRPALVRGTFVAVRIHTRSTSPLARIPLAAVQPDGTVLRAVDGSVDILPVEVVLRMENSAIVRVSPVGLCLGDHVVISPLAQVQQGMPVSASQPTDQRDATSHGHLSKVPS